MDNWIATHIVRPDGELPFEVMVVQDEGCELAFTRGDWDSYSNTDYEVDSTGAWLFQGQPFAGVVRRVPDTVVYAWPAEPGA